jgi:predicted TIM-barrel fold metal-dependent hydrolase
MSPSAFGPDHRSALVAPTGGATWPLYSCDDHIDLWALPVDLWTSRLPKDRREEGPRVVDRDGVPTWVVDGHVLGVSGEPTSGANSALARAGLGDQWQRPATPELRLADMDSDGLWASVIYGPAVLGLPIADAELKAACWRVWNDWAAEFNAHAPGRLAALPVLPTHSPQAAAAELERSAAAGHRGALVYCFEFPCGRAEWDRLWSAAQATGLPLSFHIGGGLAVPAPDSWEALSFSTLVTMQLAGPLSAMVFSGALERHPGMRLVLAEAGLGWVPYVVSRMDTATVKRKGSIRDYVLDLAPSEIFRRQVFVTFEEERDGGTFVGLLGADRCMWASDYPHADSTFPESRAAIQESFGTMSEGDRRQITADNCRRLYRFGEPG